MRLLARFAEAVGEPADSCRGPRVGAVPGGRVTLRRRVHCVIYGFKSEESNYEPRR